MQGFACFIFDEEETPPANGPKFISIITNADNLFGKCEAIYFCHCKPSHAIERNAKLLAAPDDWFMCFFYLQIGPLSAPLALMNYFADRFADQH